MRETVPRTGQSLLTAQDRMVSNGTGAYPVRFFRIRKRAVFIETQRFTRKMRIRGKKIFGIGQGLSPCMISKARNRHGITTARTGSGRNRETSLPKPMSSRTIEEDTPTFSARKYTYSSSGLISLLTSAMFSS